MPGHPPLQPGWIDLPHRRLELGDFRLESGEILREAFVTYVVHGELSAARDNAILLTTAIGATHHRLDFMIGRRKALDPADWCLIVVDALGNGLSSSPSNNAIQPGRAFPRFAIRDMVATQARVIDSLDIEWLHGVVGASMGGMQAIQWGVSHPDRVDRIVAMTPMAKTSRWSQLVNEAARRALFVDPECLNPRSREEAMRLWVPLTQLVITRTPASVEEFPTRASLLGWLDERAHWLGRNGAEAFDWLYQSWAYDDHDVGTTPGFNGDTARALASIRPRTLVMAPPLDLYNPVEAARAISATVQRGRYIEIPSRHGHVAAGGHDESDIAFMSQAIARFLRE